VQIAQLLQRISYGETNPGFPVPGGSCEAFLSLTRTFSRDWDREKRERLSEISLEGQKPEGEGGRGGG